MTGTVIERKRAKAKKIDWAQLRRRARTAARFAAGMCPGFLLSYAELMGIPSGYQIAYLAALAVRGEALLAPLCGALAALLMRFAWGAGPRPEMLLSLLMLLGASGRLHRKGNLPLMAWTAASLLPGVVVQAALGTAQGLILALGTVMASALASPVLLRGIEVWRGGRCVQSIEERTAVGFLAGIVMAGSARMMAGGLNVGVFLAALAACCMALYLDVAAGALCGLAAGLLLSLQGLPVQVSVCLAAGGFLAGMIQAVGRRWLTCAAFAAGCGLTGLLSGEGTLSVVAGSFAAPVLLALMPQRLAESIQCCFRRFLTVRPAAGDAYAAAALGRWEQTMDAVARAIPAPAPLDGPHDAAWWRARLCAECPDYAACGAMSGDFAAGRAEEAWGMRHCSDEEWPEALEKLRGLGCGRLYCLREGMNRLREEEPDWREEYRRGCYQRDMLVTHLSAMAGSARRFAQMSAGETWWDELGARNIRKLLDEQAFPAMLLYMRRIDGHACAALEMHQSFMARKLGGELCELVGAALGLEMQVERVDGDRVCLTQKPPHRIDFGTAKSGADGEGISGDHCWLGEMEQGRFVAALSDGMGQGKRAGEESRTTVELLKLCMEAGYTRSQALTAVNGMMLLETGGERFATVDLLSIDLWTGQASLDKLGAVSSWMLRGETLAELSGDALPLGILETVNSRTSLVRMKDGDRLVLLTDGVEDAFGGRAALQDAIRIALRSPTPQAAADALLMGAKEASGGGRQDDMTVAVIEMAAG